jgi:hypothetical protein
MKKEKGPIRIPRDRARRARSLKAAAVAVVNRAYLEIVASGKSHDQALGEIAAVAGLKKNAVRNWLSNTNRPGRRPSEAIVLKYDRDLSSRFGLLPLERPAPAAGVHAQGELAGVRDPGPEGQDPPASTPPAKRRRARPGSVLDRLQDWTSERLLRVAVDIRDLLRAWLDDRFKSIAEAFKSLTTRLDDRTLSILNEILSLKKYNAGLQARIEKVERGVEILVEENVPGLPPEATGRPLIGLSVQKKEDGFWLYLDDVSRGKSGAIHIETSHPLGLEILARAAGPGPAGPPPATGSDRSEPGLAEQTDDLG